MKQIILFLLSASYLHASCGMKFCTFHPKEKSWSAKWIVNHTSFDIAEYDGYYIQNTPQMAYQWKGLKFSTWIPLIFLDREDGQFLKFGNAVAEVAYQKEVTDWVFSGGVQWEFPTGNENVADVHQEFLWFNQIQWTQRSWTLSTKQGLRWNPFEEDAPGSSDLHTNRIIPLFHSNISSGETTETPSLVNLHSSFEYLQNIILSRQFELLQIGWTNSLAKELEQEKRLYIRSGLKFKKEVTNNFDFTLAFSLPLLKDKRKLLDLEASISTSW